MTRFQKIAADVAKKKTTRRVFETTLRTVLFNESIRGQRFWQVVLFTVYYPLVNRPVSALAHSNERTAGAPQAEGF